MLSLLLWYSNTVLQLNNNNLFIIIISYNNNNNNITIIIIADNLLSLLLWYRSTVLQLNNNNLVVANNNDGGGGGGGMAALSVLQAIPWLPSVPTPPSCTSLVPRGAPCTLHFPNSWLAFSLPHPLWCAISVQCMWHVGQGVFWCVHVVGVVVAGLMRKVANTNVVGLACSPELPWLSTCGQYVEMSRFGVQP